MLEIPVYCPLLIRLKRLEADNRFIGIFLEKFTSQIAYCKLEPTGICSQI
jgi:hypothetical protein